MNQKLVDIIAWWIPIKKLRDKFRAKFKEENKTDKLSAIAIYIIDKCNFSCYGCSTLSNIHENTYQDIDSFEKDLQILKKITNVNYCHLTGGEPTLHENIVEFILLVRKYFPGCGMLMVTNGIGLEKKDSIFGKHVEIIMYLLV